MAQVGEMFAELQRVVTAWQSASSWAAEARDLDPRFGRLLLQHVLAIQDGHPLVLG